MRGRPRRGGLNGDAFIDRLLVSSWAARLQWSDTPGAIIALLFAGRDGLQSALVRLLMRGVALTNVMTTNTTLLAINSAEILWLDRAPQVGRLAVCIKLRASAKRVAALFPSGLAFGRDHNRRRRVRKRGTALRIVGDFSGR
jgi:hypothetical protein